MDPRSSSLVRCTETKPVVISIDELKNLFRSSPDGRLYAAQTSCSGSANVSIMDFVPAGASDQLKRVAEYLGRQQCHQWSEDWLYVFNRPCYIVVKNGSVLLENGEVLSESVYPTAGDQTFLRQIDLPSDERIDALQMKAEDLTHSNGCVAFFSRWSSVYFHALSECLVQNFAIDRAELGECVDKIVPTELNNVQKKVLAASRALTKPVGSKLVKVKRTVFGSVARRHAQLALDFRSAVEKVKISASGLTSNVNPPKRIYISRKGETMRPLLNEDEVISSFERAGFAVVQPQKLDLLEQAHLFSNASIVVGPHGAGLANAAFAASAATIFEMRAVNRSGEIDLNESYRKLAAVMGLRYGFHLIENNMDENSWHIPSGEIEKILSRLPPVDH